MLIDEIWKKRYLLIKTKTQGLLVLIETILVMNVMYGGKQV